MRNITAVALTAAAFLCTVTADALSLPENVFLVPPNSTVVEPPKLTFYWGQTLYAKWQFNFTNVTLWVSTCQGNSGQTVFVNQPNNNSYPIYLDQSYASTDGCIDNCENCANTFTLEVHEFNLGDPRIISAPFDILNTSGARVFTDTVLSTLTETLVQTANDRTTESTLVLIETASAAVVSSTQTVASKAFSTTPMKDATTSATASTSAKATASANAASNFRAVVPFNLSIVVILLL